MSNLQVASDLTDGEGYCFWNTIHWIKLQEKMAKVDPVKCSIKPFVCDHRNIVCTHLIALRGPLVLPRLGLGVPEPSLKEAMMMGNEKPQAGKG